MKKTVLLFFSMILLVSCQKEQIQPKNLLHGKWALIKSEAGFSEPQSFEEGDIVWEIQEDAFVVEVNVNLNRSLVPFKESGTYAASIGETQITAGEETFVHYINENELILDQGSSYDAPKFTLKRMGI